MNLFSETIRWNLLSFLFKKPEAEFYVNELARAMNASASSVSITCRELSENGILNKSKKGNSLFYSLNNSNPLTKLEKSAWFLAQLLPLSKAWENEEFQSVALYGSYASGEFISKSDIDFIIITNVPDSKVSESFRLLKSKLRAEVNITVFSVSSWRKMAKEGDRFYIEVISNHIPLYGSSLVIG
ncbi:Nucleotidyltransferase domain protein [Candidatus Gugararchaeum adminiculabundum]|nr:Nucleotidyltransferase domain protein [Candidatus Gugararchaeum adminiculabundum]